MYYLGVDVGGTNIAVGIVDENNAIIAKASHPTPIPCTEDAFCDAILAVCNDALAKAGLTLDDVPWIGIGCPGTVNRATGIIEFANNLYFKNFKLRDMMAERTNGKLVILENDANAAAYGEYQAGALAGADNALAITLGTGVGGGIIINGKMVAGATGAAGEIGHMHVNDDETEPCNCGNCGCLEEYVSATGIVRMAKRKLAEDDRPSIMRKDDLSAKDVWDAVKAGDTVAIEVAEDFGWYLGKAMALVANVSNPEIFVIGGGVSKAGNVLLDYIQKYYQKYAFKGCRGALFTLATLGNDAGIYGAARLVLK